MTYGYSFFFITDGSAKVLCFQESMLLPSLFSLSLLSLVIIAGIAVYCMVVVAILFGDFDNDKNNVIW